MFYWISSQSGWKLEKLKHELWCKLSSIICIHYLSSFVMNYSSKWVTFFFCSWQRCLTQKQLISKTKRERRKENILVHKHSIVYISYIEQIFKAVSELYLKWLLCFSKYPCPNWRNDLKTDRENFSTNKLLVKDDT